MRAKLILLSLNVALSVTTARADALLIAGGEIHTLNPAQPTAEALLVSGDTIAFIGDLAAAEALADENVVRIDLAGGIAIPGLVDAHAHLNNLSRLLTRVNLIGTKSKSEVRDSALARAQTLPPGEWILGRGWDQNDWSIQEFPTAADLAQITDHPVYFRRVDGHAAWVNQLALDLCGITAATPDPAGGRIIRDSAGAPTGVFIDNATALIADHIPDTSLAQRVARYKLALAECNRLGLTGLHDAHIDSLDIAAYNTLADSGRLTLRVYGMLDSYSGSLLQQYFQSGPTVEAGGLLTIRAVKGYGDGALGSRGAALQEPYTDEPGNTGLLVTHPDTLQQLAQLCVAHGFQFCIHAIGDRGVRESLDAFASALGADSAGDHRFRVEHAQVIALEDIPRFARLGVIPAMQPTHCTSDMYWAEQRLGPQRIRGAYAWRSLLEAGCRLPLGSDFPVESVNPLWGVYAAVTRQDHSGWPEGGWYPEQRLTVEEAVRGFTSEAAYAAFDEANTGTLEVGKQADITLLKADIFSAPAAEIRDTETLATILAGRVVYRAE